MFIYPGRHSRNRRYDAMGCQTFLMFLALAKGIVERVARDVGSMDS